MSVGLILGIIFLTLLLVAMGAGIIVFIRIRSKVREITKSVFGTEDISEGVKIAEQEMAATPKSVSGTTRLCLPRISKDFPDFHYDEMKARAENVLVSYLQAVDANNAALLSEGTSELKDSLAMYLQMLENQEEKENFDNIKLHRTEIYQYRKSKGRCSIVFQSAIEYIHYVTKNGKIVRGRKDLREQAKYVVEVMYIQDREMVENMDDMGLAMTCPHCGAPLPKLGAKKCEYCDSPIVEFNIRTWNFCKVKEC